MFKSLSVAALMLATPLYAEASSFFVGDEAEKMSQYTTASGMTVLVRDEFLRYSEEPGLVVRSLLINHEQVLVLERDGQRVALVSAEMFDALTLRVLIESEGLPQDFCNSSCFDDALGGGFAGAPGGAASGAGAGAAIGAAGGWYVGGPLGAGAGGVIGGAIGGVAGGLSGAAGGAIKEYNTCEKDKYEACKKN